MFAAIDDRILLVPRIREEKEKVVDASRSGINLPGSDKNTISVTWSVIVF
jgi:hypothetical protein